MAIFFVFFIKKNVCMIDSYFDYILLLFGANTQLIYILNLSDTKYYCQNLNFIINKIHFSINYIKYVRISISLFFGDLNHNYLN